MPCPYCKSERFFSVKEKVITCQSCGRTYERIIVPSTDVRFTTIQEFIDKLEVK